VVIVIKFSLEEHKPQYHINPDITAKYDLNVVLLGQIPVIWAEQMNRYKKHKTINYFTYFPINNIGL
jgi:hypothetical protein